MSSFETSVETSSSSETRQRRSRKPVKYFSAEDSQESYEESSDYEGDENEFSPPSQDLKRKAQAKPRKVAAKKQKAEKSPEPADKTESSASEKHSLLQKLISSSFAQIPVMAKLIVSSFSSDGKLAEFIEFVIEMTSADVSGLGLRELIDSVLATDDCNFVEMFHELLLNVQSMSQDFGLGSNAKKTYSKYKEKFQAFSSKFCKQLVSSQEAKDVLPLLEKLVVAMSNTDVKSFREVGTIMALSMLKEIYYSEKDAYMEHFDNLIHGVLVNRFRDVHAEIRAECLLTLKDLIIHSTTYSVKSNVNFLSTQYLMYISQSLGDKASSIRKIAIAILAMMLEKDLEERNSVRMIIEKDKTRLLEMMAFDSDSEVRQLAVKHLLIQMSEKDFLTNDDEQESEESGDASLKRCLGLMLLDEASVEHDVAIAQVLLDMFERSPNSVEFIGFFEFLASVCLEVEKHAKSVETKLMSKFPGTTHENTVCFKSRLQKSPQERIGFKMAKCLMTNKVHESSSNLRKILFDFSSYMALFSAKFSQATIIACCFLREAVSALNNMRFDKEACSNIVDSFDNGADYRRIMYELFGALSEKSPTKDKKEVIVYLTNHFWPTLACPEDVDLLFEHVLANKKVINGDSSLTNELELKMASLRKDSQKRSVDFVKFPTTYFAETTDLFEKELKSLQRPELVEKVVDFTLGLKKFLTCCVEEKKTCSTSVNSFISTLENMLKFKVDEFKSQIIEDMQEELMDVKYMQLMMKLEEKKIELLYGLLDDLSQCFELMFKVEDRHSIAIESFVVFIIQEFLTNVLFNAVSSQEEAENIDILPDHKISDRYQFLAELKKVDDNDSGVVCLFRRYMSPFERNDLVHFAKGLFSGFGKLFAYALTKTSFASKKVMSTLQNLNSLKIISLLSESTGHTSWFGSAVDFICTEYVDKLNKGLIAGVTASKIKESDIKKLKNVYQDMFLQFIKTFNGTHVLAFSEFNEDHIASVYSSFLSHSFISKNEKIFKESMAEAAKLIIETDYSKHSDKLSKVLDAGFLGRDKIKELYNDYIKRQDSLLIHLKKSLNDPSLNEVIEQFEIGHSFTSSDETKRRPKGKRRSGEKGRSKNTKKGSGTATSSEIGDDHQHEEELVLQRVAVEPSKENDAESDEEYMSSPDVKRLKAV
ncbi:hypothetical protein MP638_000143 [Amoeboaphelidium occidentale]|nr:hypothetical protein MP638_000143 [Amoeboaphelidium occidentale]